MSKKKWEEWAVYHLDVKIRSGDEFYCICPFHEDNKPSFAFNIKKGLFICYGCGEKGTVEKLARQIKAAAIPAEATVESMRETYQQMMKVDEYVEEVRIRPESWLEQFLHTDAGDHFWRGRGISYETIDRFKLGYDYRTQAATVPLRTTAGEVVGVLRRFTAEDAEAKYKYPKGFKRTDNLFAYEHVEYGAKPLCITEGTIDALALWSIDVQAVAIYGSSMHANQRQLIARLAPRSILIYTDNDKAGEMAAVEIENLLVSWPIARAFYPPGVKDPAEMSAAMLRLSVRRSKRRLSWKG